MKFTLLHPASFKLGPIAKALAAEDVAAREVHTPQDLAVSDARAVFLLDPPSRALFSATVLRGFSDTGGGIVVLGAPGEADVPDGIPQEVVAAYVPQPCGARQLLLGLRAAYREAAARADAHRARQEAAARTRELGELTRIGIALATERDYNTLLEQMKQEEDHVARGHEV